MIRQLSLTSSLLVFIATTPASAGSLHTPALFAAPTEYPMCIATNVGTSPAEVTVVAHNMVGSTLTPISNFCPVPPATLAPNETCIATFNPGEDAGCSFTIKGKIRAALQVVTGSAQLLHVVPATAK